MGLAKPVVEEFRISGLMHDVGKIGIPEAVLTKPGRLTTEEFAQIKLHPQIGHGILEGIPGLAAMLPGVLHHHERWAGGGYPAGIAGEQIPLIARVLALADAFDAMSSNRSYRPALSRAQVFAEIRTGNGQQFDPSLVGTFLALDFSEFDRALQAHALAEHRAA
jgi:HD-GYP domain-containing protein (c-di-GMP phosphodiesterase class II)